MTDDLVKAVQKHGETTSWDWATARAPVLAAWFANLGVLFGEIRVYDVVFNITHVWWKALGATLSTGVPFVLWEIGWAYKGSRDLQRGIALLGAVGAFAMAIVLGIADYLGFDESYAGDLLTAVVLALGAHVVLALVYFFFDPDVSRARNQKQTEAWVRQQTEAAKSAGVLLAQAQGFLETRRELESQYGTEAVDEVIRQLTGESPESAAVKSRTKYALEVKNSPRGNGQQS